MKDLLRAGSWNAFSTVVRACGLIFLAHVIAVYTGPSGMGLVGQFSSIVSILFVFAGGGFGHGVIRTIGVDPTNKTEITDVLRAGSAITAISSFVVLIVCFLGSRLISRLIFGDESFAWIIRVVGVAQIFMAVYNLMLPVYSGFRRPDLLFYHYACGVFGGVVMAAIVIKKFGVDGALISVIVYQVMMVVGLIVISLKAFPLAFSSLIPKFDPRGMRLLSQYSLMALTTAVVAPLTALFIRHYIEAAYGWESVGYWQAILRISDAYIMLVVMVLMTHYLPALSHARSKTEIYGETRKLLAGMVPLGIVAAVVIFLLRDFIIRTLFSKSFVVAGDYVGWQLVIDLVRSVSWAFSYIYLARGHRNFYVFSELLCAAAIVLLMKPLLLRFGLVGAYYATLSGCLGYLIFSVLSYIHLANKPYAKD